MFVVCDVVEGVRKSRRRRRRRKKRGSWIKNLLVRLVYGANNSSIVNEIISLNKRLIRYIR